MVTTGEIRGTPTQAGQSKEMKEIPLSSSMVAIVDDADYDHLSSVKWWVNKSRVPYAVREIVRNGVRTILRMHRVIMDAPKEMEVDHINGNSLDNRRANLRLASHSENVKNRKRARNNKSGIIGVHWKKAAKKWAAAISINGVSTYLGCFSSKEEAGRVYREAAIKYKGQFYRPIE